MQGTSLIQLQEACFSGVQCSSATKAYFVTVSWPQGQDTATKYLANVLHLTKYLANVFLEGTITLFSQTRVNYT